MTKFIHQFVALAFVAALASSANAEQPTPSINVQGVGEVTANPDIAHMNVSIQVRDEEMAEAREEASDSVGKALKVLNELKILPKDIHTSGITVRPEFNYRKDERELIGYFVSREIRVTLRDITSVGLLTEKLLDAGINNGSSPQFASSKKDQLQREAIKLAAADAKANALAAADGLGLKLGSVLSLNANSRNPAPSPRMRMASPMAMEKSMSAADTYQVGEIKYSATVSAQFAIAD